MAQVLVLELALELELELELELAARQLEWCVSSTRLALVSRCEGADCHADVSHFFECAGGQHEALL